MSCSGQLSPLPLRAQASPVPYGLNIPGLDTRGVSPISPIGNLDRLYGLNIYQSGNVCDSRKKIERKLKEKMLYISYFLNILYIWTVLCNHSFVSLFNFCLVYSCIQTWVYFCILTRVYFRIQTSVYSCLQTRVYYCIQTRVYFCIQTRVYSCI